MTNRKTENDLNPKTLPSKTVSGRRSAIGDVAVKSVAWLALNSIFARILSFVVNLFLAWLLLEEDFGLYGLANTVIAFTSVLTNGPIVKILFFRRKRFFLWANAVHWLSVVLGVATTALTLLIGFAMVAFMQLDDAGKFMTLVSIMSVTPLVGSFGVVASAKLRLEMRFGEISLVESGMLAFVAVGKVVLAATGFGALSFVIPTLVGTFGKSLAYLKLAKPEFKKSFEVKKWSYIYGKSALLLGTTFLTHVMMYGDYAIVSQFVSQKHLGIFFFAFNYAVLGVMLLMTGLSDVLLQVFTREPDASKRFPLFEKSAKTACLIIFPACFLQAAVALPISHFVLPERWLSAIVLLQILSLGMPGRALSWLGVCLMESQGRFRQRFLLSLASAASFIVFVLAGCFAGRYYAEATSADPAACTLLGLAIAEAIYFPMNSFFTVWISVGKETPTPLHAIWNIVSLPLAGSTLAVGVGWLLGRSLEPHWLASALVMLSVSTVIYVSFVRIYLPEQFHELSSRMTVLLRSLAERGRRLAWASPN